MSVTTLDPSLLESPLSHEVEPSQQSTFEIVPADEYIDSLCREIELAKEEIHIQAMAMQFRVTSKNGSKNNSKKDSEGDGSSSLEKEKQLFEAILKKRAEQGNVRITLYLSSRSVVSREDAKALNALHRAGVELVYTNMGYLLPDQQGQNHMKLAMFDRRAYFGGVNIHSEVIHDTLDCMIATDDPSLCGVISETLEKNRHLHRDRNHPFDRYQLQSTEDPNPFLPENCKFDVIVENGASDRRSEIIDQAVALVEQAQERVVVASQFLPDGRLFNALIEAAKRGVEIVIISNDPEHIWGNIYRQSARLSRKRFDLAVRWHNYLQSNNGNGPINLKIHELNSRVHLKMVMADDETVVFGSENFIRLGELLETSEFSVITDHEGIVAGLKGLVNDFCKKNNIGEVFI